MFLSRRHSYDAGWPGHARIDAPCETKPIWWTRRGWLREERLAASLRTACAKQSQLRGLSAGQASTVRNKANWRGVEWDSLRAGVRNRAKGGKDGVFGRVAMARGSIQARGEVCKQSQFEFQPPRLLRWARNDIASNKANSRATTSRRDTPRRHYGWGRRELAEGPVRGSNNIEKGAGLPI
jgi:hypothetical protein